MELKNWIKLKARNAGLRIRHWWHIAYIRKDILHKSLWVDKEYMDLLRPFQKEQYLADLEYRRKISQCYNRKRG